VKIAVVGAGIAGIGSAWLLSPSHDVDVYEAETWLGGHARTMDVTAGGQTFPIDAGFMVFNRRTYPNLIRFFERLGVRAHDADMSFSVQIAEDNIEWAGSSLGSVFAQPKNLANPRFLRMLTDIARFSRQADALMADPTVDELTLGQLLEREGYSGGFTDWYLIPMGDAIWSTPPGEMLDYPASTFLRFCDNHGLLHISGKPQWLSVDGGARTYVEAASKTFSGEVFDAEPAERIERAATGVTVHTARRSRHYDAVVLASHPPQSRMLLGDAIAPVEREVLGAFEYWPNDVVIHSDESFMPKSRKAWASWNWYSGSVEADKKMLMLSYRLNTLQHLPDGVPSVIETLNRDHEPAEDSVFARMVFDHPMYSRAAIKAQRRLQQIQGTDGVYYAGAWTRYGFHEDGMLSGVRVAEMLGAPLPWAEELDESRTRRMANAPVPRLGQARELLPVEFA